MKKIFCIVSVIIAVCLVANAAFAVPSVKRSNNTFTIEEAVNDDILAQIKAEIGKVDQAKLGFILKKIANDDLARLCAAYPNYD